ncbi:hypothetical protein [Burkholderia sp. A9]|nr:hypothetical protein [Burkholderia sp. A9]
MQLSGDLAGFDVREDAIVFAKSWALAWLEAHWVDDLPASMI